MIQSKIKKKQDSYESSIKIKEMRENITRSLNDKKMMKFQENRLTNLQMKQKKIVLITFNCQEGDEVRKEKIKEESDKAKKIADMVKNKEKEFQEKKKQMDIDKMLKMKQELEQKLLDEESKKLKFEVY